VIRVIQNREGLYLEQGGAWTMRFDLAEKFGDSGSAILAMQRYQLQNVYLVLIVHDEPQPQWDVVFPLRQA
jgi:hypothetical protein